MTAVSHIIQCMQQLNVPVNPDRIEAAYNFAAKAHEGQSRASGDPYITHPVAVALQLAQLKQDEDTVIAGFLHDVLEDTQVPEEALLAEFGPIVLRLVKGVTNVRYPYDREAHLVAKNLKRFFLAVQHDIRVLVIKLTDRLHNMRTLHYIQSPEKRRYKALETRDVYIPLADYAGLFHVRNELIDLTLQHLEPQTYTYIHSKLNDQYTHGESDIDIVIHTIEDLICENNLSAQVIGRLKTVSSIWSKMQYCVVQFDQLSDIVGFRILVDTVEECYRLQKMLASEFKVMPGSFKDYIRLPKKNYYQSLHCVFKVPPYEHIEVQIRTKNMHDIAENGIANHARYKQRYRENLYPFIGKIMQQILPNAVAHFQLPRQCHKKKIYCFTPRGDVIFLPEKSSCLDFAYKLHSEIGQKATHALVNGLLTGLNTQLKTGDEVYIQVVEHPHMRSFSKQHLMMQNSQNYLALQTTSDKQQLFKNQLQRAEFKYDESIVTLMLKVYGVTDRIVFWQNTTKSLEGMVMLYRLLFKLKYRPSTAFKVICKHKEQLHHYQFQKIILHELQRIFSCSLDAEIISIEKAA